MKLQVREEYYNVSPSHCSYSHPNETMVGSLGLFHSFCFDLGEETGHWPEYVLSKMGGIYQGKEEK